MRMKKRMRIRNDADAVPLCGVRTTFYDVASIAQHWIWRSFSLQPNHLHSASLGSCHVQGYCAEGHCYGFHVAEAGLF